jgi:hypothetical protein
VDLGLTLTLVGVLAGLWAYLHTTIVTLTTSAPADVSVLPLGIVHWFVTIYLAFALYVLYERGHAHANQGRQGEVEQVLLTTWPFPFIGALFVIAAARVIPDTELYLKASAVIAIAITGLGVIWLTFRSQRKAWLLVALLVIGWLPFTLIMSQVFAGAEIKTEKEFYRQQDDVIVSIRRSGYVFLPTIKRVEFGTDRREGGVKETLLFTATQHSGSDLIVVRFVPQFISVERTVYHQLKMTR